MPNIVLQLGYKYIMFDCDKLETAMLLFMDAPVSSTDKDRIRITGEELALQGWKRSECVLYAVAAAMAVNQDIDPRKV